MKHFCTNQDCTWKGELTKYRIAENKAGAPCCGLCGRSSCEAPADHFEEQRTLEGLKDDQRVDRTEDADRNIADTVEQPAVTLGEAVAMSDQQFEQATDPHDSALHSFALTRGQLEAPLLNDDETDRVKAMIREDREIDKFED